MNNIKYPSKLLDNAVNEFAKLPGIGGKTALRLVLHMLKQDQSDVRFFGNTLVQLREEVKHCKQCNNISDTDVCAICSDPTRDKNIVCVVENIKNIMSIEHTQQYKGVYHVLGGIISPMDGIGPSDLNIIPLLARLETGEVDEVILALSTTMEGDTTNFFLYKKMKNMELNVTTIARGVSVGDELEYTDEITLGRSLRNRIPFTETLY